MCRGEMTYAAEQITHLQTEIQHNAIPTTQLDLHVVVQVDGAGRRQPTAIVTAV